MSISVALDPGTAPVVNVTIATPDGSNMTAASLNRVTGGLAEMARVQPITGLASTVVQDIDALWDIPVVYSATITYGGTTTTFTSDPIVLSATGAWMLHPSLTTLSVQIDQGETDQIGVVSIGDVTWASTAQEHTPIGSRYPVITTYGPRQAAKTSMVIETVTAADEDALRTLIDDQSPLLIRFPSDSGANFEDGWYSIGDASASRVQQWVEDTRRQFTLALTRTTAPAITQQSTWDYPALTAAFADYAALTAAFADYPSLTADIRSA